MPSFDSSDFGSNIRRIRSERGFSQENLAHAIGKTKSTVARYENGTLMPSAEIVTKICNELKVDESQLFNSQRKLVNIENSKNPFKTDTLYLYYMGHFSDNSFKPCCFILKIYEKENSCKVELKNANSDTIYLNGYLVSDDNLAVCILENYKPLFPRFEVAELTINIANGTNNIMIGSYMGTDKSYTPTFRKCVISKNMIPDEEENEVRELLTVDKKDKKIFNENDVLYLHSNIKQDYDK